LNFFRNYQISKSKQLYKKSNWNNFQYVFSYGPLTWFTCWTTDPIWPTTKKMFSANFKWSPSTLFSKLWKTYLSFLQNMNYFVF
jgi:hypothetical protein